MGKSSGDSTAMLCHEALQIKAANAGFSRSGFSLQKWF